MKMYSLLSFYKHADFDIAPFEWSNSQKQGLIGHSQVEEKKLGCKLI
jgi:hypothetical protein